MKISKEEIDLLAHSLKEHNLSGIEYSDNDFSLKLTDNGVNNHAPFFLNNNKFDSQTKNEEPQLSNENPELAVESSEVKGTKVKSPIVGNYYNTKKPGEPPFIKVGDKIQAGDVVAIIEAMKVMNEVKSPVSGIVRELLIENGEFVDTMTEIMTIEEE